MMTSTTDMVSARTNTVSTQSPDVEVDIVPEKIIFQLQEELDLIRQENKQCWRRVQHLETIIARMRSAAQCSKDERDMLKKKVRELQSRFAGLSSPISSVENNSSRQHQCEVNVTLADSECQVSSQPLSGATAVSSVEFRPPTPAIAPKVAERIRLKRFFTDDVHGSEICSLGVSNVRVAEHLVESVQEASTMQELYRSLETSARQQEFEIELENLKHQANRMRAQISFLELTLLESRALSDNLSTICAQLESNTAALQLALLLDEYIEQASACSLELAESRLAFVLASCQAVHCDKDDNEMLSLARKERERLEYDAKKLLKRLEIDATALIGSVERKSGNDPENAEEDGEVWSRRHEIRLRSLTAAMKTQRNAIRRSVADIQVTSLTLNSTIDNGTVTTSSLQEEKLSLENVVLLQELVAIKEEKAQLKGKLFVLQKENEILKLTVREKNLSEESLRQRLDVFSNCGKQANDESETCAGKEPDIFAHEESSELLEALMATQELRQRKNDTLVEYLKRINDSLLVKLQRSKRKHKAKLRRLQHALRYVGEQYELELSALRGQLASEAARDSVSVICEAMSGAKRQLFGVKKVEAEPVDDQKLEEILEQLDEHAEVILIKKPAKLSVDDILITPEGDGSLKVVIKDNQDDYHIDCTAVPHLNRTSSLLVRQRPPSDPEDGGEGASSASAVCYSEAPSAMLGVCRITSGLRNNPEPKQFYSSSVAAEEREALLVRMRQRYVPFGCPAPKRKRKSESKRPRKKRRHDENED